MTISFPQFFSSLVQPVRQFKHLKNKKFPGCPPCIPFHGPNYLEWQKINTQPTRNNPEFFKILNVNQPLFRIWSTSVLFYISKYLKQTLEQVCTVSVHGHRLTVLKILKQSFFFFLTLVFVNGDNPTVLMVCLSSLTL